VKRLELGLTDELRNELINAASASVLVVERMLKHLLDCYDFYAERYEGGTHSAKAELDDLNVSVKEFAVLPYQVAVAITCWKNDEDMEIGTSAFELDVLNECNLHMNAVSTFMHRKGLDMEAYEPLLVAQAFAVLRNANRMLAK
jgi:hypothetical protein